MTEHKKVKYYFDDELARLLTSKIRPVYSSFNGRSFSKKIGEQVGTLEYKDRVRVFAEELRNHLPDPYKDALQILTRILGPENKLETGMFTEGYWIAPIAYFVEVYGLDHYAPSMRAIAEITKRHTSEYAIRPYLELHPDKTLRQMVRWSTHSNFHIRRLASEGVRPRLPWAKKIDAYIESPTPIIPILENLKNDEIKYVQKSVANCINDILKDNPKTALSLLTKWAKNNPPKSTQWIIKHSLRKLSKQNDTRAQRILSRFS